MIEIFILINQKIVYFRSIVIVAIAALVYCTYILFYSEFSWLFESRRDAGVKKEKRHLELFRPTTLLTPASPPFTHFYHPPLFFLFPKQPLAFLNFQNLLCHTHLPSFYQPSEGFFGVTRHPPVVGERGWAVNSACHLHAARNILKGKPLPV